MSADGLPEPFLVLLVDDDLRTSRRLAEMLREDGLAVELARDGAAAIARFTHAPLPNVLVTELTTAHVDAASVSRFARAQRPGMPILVVTGYPNLFHPLAFGGKAPQLFTKPVDYSKLKDALIQALQSSAESSLEMSAKVVPAALESKLTDAPALAGDTLSGAQTLRAVRRSRR